MSALDRFSELIETTGVVREIRRSLREEPAHLLGEICREYEESGRPVPDHRLRFVGFMGEAALRAVMAAGLVSRQSGGRLSLYAYEPTPEGLEHYRRLKAEGFFGK